MMEGITIIVLEEILMANGLTVLMMWFLLFCRRKNRESLHVGDKIYDGITCDDVLIRRRRWRRTHAGGYERDLYCRRRREHTGDGELRSQEQRIRREGLRVRRRAARGAGDGASEADTA